MTHRTLHEGFLRAAQAFPSRPALEVDGATLVYAELRDRALSIAATIAAHRPDDAPPLTAVLGQRTASSFAGILGAACAGHGYVPVLPTYPAARVATILQRAGARSLVLDAASAAILPEVLDRTPRPITVLSLDAPLDPGLAGGRHVLLGPADLRPVSQWTAPAVGPHDVAYLLFTSGSTGQPKGVMVAQRNIAHFLDVVTSRYALEPEDRFSHMFEPTFDLSLFDLFGAWHAGACLCCPDARQRLLPARYVVDAGLTIWFSVPSSARLMLQTRTLAPGAFPRLRWSLFCGEALTVDVAEAWSQAAPRSIVENLYGPTELTLACTVYRHGPHTAAEAQGDIVPIGAPLPGMRAIVADEELAEVPPGGSGELLVAGPQVALGYVGDPERTEIAFTTPPGEREIFYRTGDRVVRPADPEGPLRFVGRLDHQIKLRGYRVELGEIEAVIRRAAGVRSAVALGWPEAPGGGADGIVAFVDDASIDVAAVLRKVAEILPRYMVPRELHVLDALPMGESGKIDRNALRATLRDASERC